MNKKIRCVIESNVENNSSFQHDNKTFSITQRAPFQMEDNNSQKYEHVIMCDGVNLAAPTYWRPFQTHIFISWDFYVKDKNDKSLLNDFNIPNGIDVTNIKVLQNVNHLADFNNFSSTNNLLKYGFYASNNVTPRDLVIALSNAEKCPHKIFESSFEKANDNAYIRKDTSAHAVQTRQLLYGMIAYKDLGDLNIVKHDNGSETLSLTDFNQFMFTHCIEYKVGLKVEEAA